MFRANTLGPNTTGESAYRYDSPAPILNQSYEVSANSKLSKSAIRTMRQAMHENPNHSTFLDPRTETAFVKLQKIKNQPKSVSRAV